MTGWAKFDAARKAAESTEGKRSDYAVLKDSIPKQAHNALHSYFASGRKLPSTFSVSGDGQASAQRVGKALNYVAMAHRGVALVHQRAGRTAMAANYRKKADAIESVAKTVAPDRSSSAEKAAKNALGSWMGLGNKLPPELKNTMDKSPDALAKALNYAAMGYRASSLKHSGADRDTLAYSHHKRAVQLERLAKAVSPKGPSSTSASKKARRVARDNPMGVTRRDIRSALQEGKLDLSPANRQKIVDEVHAHANRIGMYGVGSGKRITGADIANMFSGISGNDQDKLANIIDDLKSKGKRI